MPKRPLPFTSESDLTISEIQLHAHGWLLDGEMRNLSPQTLAFRRLLTEKLVWFLQHREFPRCGLMEVRSFLAYVNRGHEEPGGRWGNPKLTQPVKSWTSLSYYTALRTFFRFLVEEGALDDSPLERLKPPIHRDDQIQPFTPEQVQALFAAARKTRHPKRDELIVFLLLDTGMRVSELCGISVSDVDLSSRRVTVTGKGNKKRSLPYAVRTSRALWAYLKERERGPSEPLFPADSGTRTGERLTRSGVLQLIERLGKVAGVQSARCSPHTFRHTFAISFLRAGGSIYVLQELMGHSTLSMVKRYLAIAQADMDSQHRQFSPVDRLKGWK